MVLGPLSVLLECNFIDLRISIEVELDKGTQPELDRESEWTVYKLGYSDIPFCCVLSLLLLLLLLSLLSLLLQRLLLSLLSLLLLLSLLSLLLSLLFLLLFLSLSSGSVKYGFVLLYLFLFLYNMIIHVINNKQQIGITAAMMIIDFRLFSDFSVRIVVGEADGTNIVTIGNSLVADGVMTVLTVVVPNWNPPVDRSNLAPL